LSSDVKNRRWPAIISRIIAALFAIVGFVASIATIYQLTNEHNADLHLSATITDGFVPYSVARQFTLVIENGDISRNKTFDELSYLCREESLLSKGERDVSDKLCIDFAGLKETSNIIQKLSTSDSTILIYEIENKGKRKASNIRLQGDRIIVADFYISSRKYIKITPSQKTGDYLLPDLNPGEKLKAIIWINKYYISKWFQKMIYLPSHLVME
jgi:hypothetical protein